MDLLQHLTQLYNSITKGTGGPVTIHLRFGPVLYIHFTNKMAVLQRERPEKLINVINDSGHLMFKSGTVHLDNTLSPWGYTYTVEHRIPQDCRE